MSDSIGPTGCSAHQQIIVVQIEAACFIDNEIVNNQHASSSSPRERFGFSLEVLPNPSRLAFASFCVRYQDQLRQDCGFYFLEARGVRAPRRGNAGWHSSERPVRHGRAARGCAWVDYATAVNRGERMDPQIAQISQIK